MTYIRVVDNDTNLKVDLNTAHIVGFAPATDSDGAVTSGTHISLSNGGVYHVSDTPRSVRGFINKATGRGNSASAKEA
jgi:hypothetical protein